MTSPDPVLFILADGAIQLSIHQESSIHLHAVSPPDDPVELSSAEALEGAALSPAWPNAWDEAAGSPQESDLTSPILTFTACDPTPPLRAKM